MKGNYMIEVGMRFEGMCVADVGRCDESEIEEVFLKHILNDEYDEYTQKERDEYASKYIFYDEDSGPVERYYEDEQSITWIPDKVEGYADGPEGNLN